MFEAKNYTGIHLTAQISKVAKRLLALCFAPFLSATAALGENQFAYQKERGSRDAVAFLTLTWLREMASRKRVAVYCSDVAGAFDRVDAKRLVEKLRASGMDESIVRVLDSWLRKRSAKVVVEGKCSKDMSLEDMVFQGTVLGPVLWNAFFADAKLPIRFAGFKEIVYADDLNAWKSFLASVPSDVVHEHMDTCQASLHEWGNANRVVFDAGKESKHILSVRQPEGENFKLLGVLFDCRLHMQDAVTELVGACAWKAKRILTVSQGLLLSSTRHMCFRSSSTRRQACTMPLLACSSRWTGSRTHSFVISVSPMSTRWSTTTWRLCGRAATWRCLV